MTATERTAPGLAPQPHQVQLIDGALPVELYTELQRYASRIGWQFGWNTPSNVHSRYWHHEVGYGAKANTEDVSDRVRTHPEPALALYLDWLKSQLVVKNARVLRFYFNAHTYGTDGWPHTDADRPGELTAVLYLNGQWKPEWCGETVVFNGRGDIIASVLPAANRLLTFPSDWLHAPRPLSKSFEGLRVVLVAKMGPADVSGG